MNEFQLMKHHFQTEGEVRIKYADQDNESVYKKHQENKLKEEFLSVDGIAHPF